jgi:hypothetical protein
MKDDLRKKAGARLKMLITDFNVMSKQALADALGVDPRSVHNWYQSMPPHRAREVASKIGLAYNYFEISDSKLERKGITPFLANVQKLKPRKQAITFDGTTTLTLTRFLSANHAALKPAIARIQTHGELKSTYDVNGANLSAHADGYIRTLVHHGANTPDFIGGTNAVVEDHRLSLISFKKLQDELVVFEGSTFRCLTDEELVAEGVALPSALMRWHMPAEALHYVARLPNAATFQILMTALEENWTRFDICELAFDALKKFWAHLSLNRSDRLRAETTIVKFLKAYSNTEEAQAAVAYAVEALPFCSHSNRDARIRAGKLIDNIRHNRLHFSKLGWEANFAARVALDFLPFVNNPDGFEIPSDHSAGLCPQHC